MATFVKMKLKRMKVMMKRNSLLLVLVLCAMAANAQLLWKVSGNGLARPSYILGTYHLAPAAMIDDIPGMQQAFEGCDIVIGEVDQGVLTKPDMMLAMAQAMMAPSDSTLDKLFTPEKINVIEQIYNKYCSSLGIPFILMKRFKPAAVSFLIAQAKELQRVTDADPAQLIDMAVQLRGNKMGRPTMGLETIDEQIGFLFSSPIDMQANRLLELCENDDLAESQSNELCEAYMSQDLDRIEKMFFDPDLVEMDQDEMKTLVVDRNNNWMEKLVKMMPERACLVVVGAGHLIGDKGLLQQFRDRGYTVEPMQ